MLPSSHLLTDFLLSRLGVWVSSLPLRHQVVDFVHISSIGHIVSFISSSRISLVSISIIELLRRRSAVDPIGVVELAVIRRQYIRAVVRDTGWMSVRCSTCRSVQVPVVFEGMSLGCSCSRFSSPGFRQYF